MPNGNIRAKCNCGATVGICNCLCHEASAAEHIGEAKPIGEGGWCFNCGVTHTGPHPAATPGVAGTSAEAPI